MVDRFLAGLIVLTFMIQGLIKIVLDRKQKEAAPFGSIPKEGLLSLFCMHLVTPIAFTAPPIVAFIWFVGHEVYPMDVDVTAGRVLRVIGLPLVFIGYGLTAWARIQRWYEWAPQAMSPDILQAHHLETGGPYAYVRHPSYTGLMFAGIGTFLALGSWLILYLPLFWMFLDDFVVAREERDLAERYPEEFASYRGRVKKYLPGIY